ncbi:hypothetical protein Tco_1463794, partial [Tanacetum coccineum]
FIQKQSTEEEKEKKKDEESSKQVEEDTVQKEDVIPEQVVKESSRKAEGRLKRKDSKAREDKDKRQKKQNDPEKLMEYVEVISDSDEVISVTPLAVKSPIMLNDFDREDLIVLYRLFNEKYASTRPGFDDLMLWEDMKDMFEPNSDDAVWKNHNSQELIEWKLYDSLGSTSGIRAFALRNFDLEVMEFESAHSNTTAKLPILKLENGNLWVSVPQTAQENGTLVTKMSMPVTAEEKTNKKNDVKSRSLLLMALPNEHQLTFSQYNDAKIMFATIETQFGGNEATKKTQKTLLKQQYENFSASSTKSLDSIFNRLQKIVSRLAILGVVITQEDLNSKFLRSLPPE